MGVYVDPLREYSKRAGEWCHMLADTLEELHATASRIGVPERGFHRRTRHPHYDLDAERRERAIAAGAVEVSRRELGLMLTARTRARRA